MQDLTLVGVHDDGEHLILTDATGQLYRVRVDEPLRAAVRRDRARLGQLQVEAEGLRPREIQARIRAGQTAEEVAEAAGVPIEHVRRFEGPVLAEREFVATQARNVRLRRPGSGMTSSTLGELVQQRLGQREVDDADITWDAWRDEDGTWVVCLSFHAGSTRRRAHWAYDTQLRHVSARDDEARWLTEEERTEVSGQRRLTPIRDTRDLRDPIRDIIRDRGAETDNGRPADRHAGDRHAGDRHAGDRYTGDRYTGDRYTDDRYATDRHGMDRQGSDRHVATNNTATYNTAAHNRQDDPEEQYHPDRYESTRFGEDRFREDPYREEIYGEDRPAEVRRATVDLLDTLRERRGRRQRLAPADPGSRSSDAVDAAVETLRTRADALTDPSVSRPGTCHEDAPDPELIRLPDDDEVDVIELPDDVGPPHRNPGLPPSADTPDTDTPDTDAADTGTSGTQGTPGPPEGLPVPTRKPRRSRPSAGERGAMAARRTSELATETERPAAPDRPAARTAAAARAAAAGQQVVAGKRPVERSGDPGPRETGQRSTDPRETGQRSTGLRDTVRRGPGARTGVPAATAANAPATPGPSSSGRGAGTRGAGGRTSAPIGYPSPAAPPAPSPAPAPAPARDRQATGPVDGDDPVERPPSTPRRNKRASVPSWDDIVFGSRRE